MEALAHRHGCSPPIAVEHWGGGCSPTAVDSSFMAVEHPQPPSVALRTALAVAERPSPTAPCRCQTVSSGLLSGVGCSPTLVDDPPPPKPPSGWPMCPRHVLRIGGSVQTVPEVRPTADVCPLSRKAGAPPRSI